MSKDSDTRIFLKLGLETLDQKSDFEPATGHKFLCLNMILLYLKIMNQSLNPN
jgi:hypothetical protein